VPPSACHAVSSEPSYIVRAARWPEDAPALRAIRARVFVIEQGVPEHLEWDGRDESAIHLLAETGNGVAIGTARLLADGRLGRMAVLPEYRGRGVGSLLLQEALQRARAAGHPCLRLHAQSQVVDFYRRFGFEPVGEPFEEAGIPHRAMQLAIQ
jgi:predicted GNAT family N-acyltransferase